MMNAISSHIDTLATLDMLLVTRLNTADNVQVVLQPKYVWLSTQVFFMVKQIRQTVVIREKL